MSRTQSIMRIATTASPVSGSDVRERMAALELASTRLNAVKTMQRNVKFWRQYTRIKKGISNSRENSESASKSASPHSFRRAAAAAAPAPAPSSAETGQLQRPPPRPRSSAMLDAFASLSENGGTPAVADLAADLTSPTLTQSLTPAAAPSAAPSVRCRDRTPGQNLLANSHPSHAWNTNCSADQDPLLAGTELSWL